MRFAAALHDVGKLSISSQLLDSLETPSGSEVLELRKHAASGADLLMDEFDLEVCEWIAAHHERWDGFGYPFGLFGADIPFGSRIIAVAETFDVLIQESGWRNPLPEDAALDELKRCAGTQFDAEAVEAFLLVQPLIQPVIV
jgi:HD-GYP domain-containing protein (c-di-GMP phosphodiesterase class II)